MKTAPVTVLLKQTNVLMAAECRCGFAVLGRGEKGAKSAQRAFDEHVCEHRKRPRLRVVEGG